MPDQPGVGEAPSGTRGGPGDLEALMARGQRLVQSPRPPGGRSTAWHVEAFYLGDFAALAASALRDSGRD